MSELLVASLHTPHPTVFEIVVAVCYYYHVSIIFSVAPVMVISHMNYILNIHIHNTHIIITITIIIIIILCCLCDEVSQR